LLDERDSSAEVDISASSYKTHELITKRHVIILSLEYSSNVHHAYINLLSECAVLAYFSLCFSLGAAAAA
jgi:hypothetical protein